MWFDPKAKLAEIANDTPATQAPEQPPVSQLSQRPRNGPKKARTLGVGDVDEILNLIRGAESISEVRGIMESLRTTVDDIAANPEPLEAVRATHIRNLAEYRLRRLEHSEGKP